ncbi:MAG: hypothetical protein M3115_03860 [Thermoproteota archaeon]|nr:hypothetical protein [Thermoproteota archaeon]
MKNKKKHKQKLFDGEREKRIKFEGILPVNDYQRDYFTGYPYGYWLHKGLALMNFIGDRSKLSMLRYSKDIDSDDFIIGNLKMEIHMMVFHSAESLFLTVLGHYFYAEMPWFWMSICTQTKFNNIMNLWQEKGLDAIIKEPEEWLRDILYPTINKSHEGYLKTKRSASFAKKYLDRLVQEYMRHKEYNAYKHGLRVFPSHKSLEVKDGIQGDSPTDSQQDFLEFLRYELLEETEHEYRIKSTSIKYDVKVDMNIIRTNTWLLQNFLRENGLKLKQ